MSRQYHPLTIKILEILSKSAQEESAEKLFRQSGAQMPYKDFYNIIFRLSKDGLVEKFKTEGKLKVKISNDGKKLLWAKNPVKDGIWKLVIFDIPEKQKKVRQILRAKLTALHFKKWQNSIWISPYALDSEIEAEFNELAKKFFIRLIKTKDINETGDLEKLFS